MRDGGREENQRPADVTDTPFSVGEERTRGPADESKDDRVGESSVAPKACVRDMANESDVVKIWNHRRECSYQVVSLLTMP